MKKAPPKKATKPRNRITICLPGALDTALRQEATTSPNGELTPVILRYIALGMGKGMSMSTDQSVAPSPTILPAVMKLGAAIDFVREADGFVREADGLCEADIGENQALVMASQLYGLLLEKAIYVEGVSE